MAFSPVRTLIVDDEQHCRETLQWQLAQYCPEIHVAAVCGSGESALAAIAREQPALVFLDVEMPEMNAFEMLARLSSINFEIVFTTAFAEYAIRAIRSGAIDYLIKPVDKDELRAAVNNYFLRMHPLSEKQLEALFSHTLKAAPGPLEKIAFPVFHGFELVPVKDIVACEGDSNYTKVHRADGSVLLVSRTLKETADILDKQPFFRIHHSFLVNLDYAVRYIRGEGGFLVFVNDLQVPVSRSKKEDLLKILTHLSA